MEMRIQCDYMISTNMGYDRRQCAKKAVIARYGKNYCTIHDPEHRAEKKQKQKEYLKREYDMNKKRHMLDEQLKKIGLCAIEAEKELQFITETHGFKYWPVAKADKLLRLYGAIQGYIAMITAPTE